MKPTRLVALIAGRTAGFLSRRLGVGGGTTLPGLVAQHLDPTLVPTLCARMERGVLLITGTNGKTTTARMLARLLQAAGWQSIHNRAGANLVAGIATALLYASDWQGRPHGDSGLFEVDEAHLPQAVALCRPRLVLLHNLFRDQLDRYGEVDYVAGRWGEALRALPPEAHVVLNADDPAVADLGHDLSAQVCYYGMNLSDVGSPMPDHTADAQFCRRCGAPYRYAPAYYGHIGRYRCLRCGHQRPQPHVYLAAWEPTGSGAARGHLVTPEGSHEITLPLPGLYNAYNVLGAITAALALKLDLAQALAALASFRAAFGRLEHIPAAGREVLIALIKNPVGAGQVIHMLTQNDRRGTYLIVINDRIADGTDVSWLWDADFELLAGRVDAVTVSGTRAHDMAMRLKYAGVEKDRITVEADLAQAFDRALAQTPPGQTLHLLPTYTAMLEVRSLMARRGYTAPFWED